MSGPLLPISTNGPDLCRLVESVLRHSGLIDWNEQDWALRELALEIVAEIFPALRPNSSREKLL